MTSFSKAIAACALMILLGIGMLSYRSTVRSQEDREGVMHTHLVLEKLQAVLIDVTQTESGQRGYILTGDEKYLKPYQAGRDQVHPNIEEARKLTADNPRQQDAIRGLKQLVDARLALLGGRIEIRRTTGLMAGAEAVRTSDSEESMEGIRERINEMWSTEERLLNIRLEAAIASSRQMKAVIVLGNALATLILLMAGVVIHRETGRRNLAEQGLNRAKERLERRTAELSETNIELESFAYSVAHDLRAPLRHIAGYSNVLTEDYGPQLDGEGRRHLEKLVNGAQKMGRLVDDLLSLSKIGRQELSLEAVPLDALLREVVEEVGRECSGREIEWRIGDLFNTDCDPGLMKQVFVNLLSNAVKYTARRKHAVIEVGQTIQNDKRVVFVRDNGVGFEMQYVDKLFGVFQRLHKARDFEGTGVGLAIVQRIIQRHRGRIWAEAETDHGATFFFALGTPENIMKHEPELTITE